MGISGNLRLGCSTAVMFFFTVSVCHGSFFVSLYRLDNPCYKILPMPLVIYIKHFYVFVCSDAATL
jgi:hypothetical protein